MVAWQPEHQDLDLSGRAGGGAPRSPGAVVAVVAAAACLERWSLVRGPTWAAACPPPWLLAERGASEPFLFFLRIPHRPWLVRRL
jgi:hypothetical protein